MTQRAPSRSIDARAGWHGTACCFTLTQLEAAHSQGTVRLVFQPAEEGGAGGDVMIKEGALRALFNHGKRMSQSQSGLDEVLV